MAATEAAGKALRELLTVESLAAAQAAALQRALTDLHLIDASLLDPSLHDIVVETDVPQGGAVHHAA